MHGGRWGGLEGGVYVSAAETGAMGKGDEGGGWHGCLGEVQPLQPNDVGRERRHGKRCRNNAETTLAAMPCSDDRDT